MRSPTTGWGAPRAPAARHGLIGRFVDVLEPHTESDPAAILVQALVAFGNVIGRSAYFEVEANRHYLNLFAALVGATAKGRKGTSWGHVQRLFAKVDPSWSVRITSNLASGEGLVWAVRDHGDDVDGRPGRAASARQVLADDKRLLVLEPEFASPLRVMRREGNTISTVVRQAWDSGNLNTLTKNNPAIATGAHISIIGHVTRTELVRYLNETETANGFANRFLWTAVRRGRVLPDGGCVPVDALDELCRAFQDRLQFAASAGRMQRDELAGRLWRSIYKQLSDGGLGVSGAVTSRAEAQVTRLSCLYALLEGSATISEEHLRAALAVWQYCQDSAYFIFGGDVGDAVADQILRALRRSADGLARTEINRLFSRNRSSAQIARALSLLQEGGLAEPIAVSGPAGRPREVWRVTTLEAQDELNELREAGSA